MSHHVGDRVLREAFSRGHERKLTELDYKEDSHQEVEPEEGARGLPTVLGHPWVVLVARVLAQAGPAELVLALSTNHVGTPSVLLD